jgi:hypothetical protein
LLLGTPVAQCSPTIGVTFAAALLSRRHEQKGAIMAKTVVGFFDTYDEARGAYDELARQSIDRHQMSLITNRQTYRGSDAVTEPDEQTSAAVGAATGAVVGGSIALIASLVPGVGPVLAVGPLLAALFGAGVGAVAGGMIGALVDIGVPEEEARLYQEGVRRGGTLLIVHSPDNKAAKRAAAIMSNFGVEDIKRRSADWQLGSEQKTAAPSTSPAAAAGGSSPPAQPGEERIEDGPRRDEMRIPIGGPDSDNQDVPVSTVVEAAATLKERPVNPGEASRIQDRPASGAPMRADQGGH